MNSGIYKIENLVNGKLYIGRSNNLKARQSSHWNQLKRNVHTNTHLQHAWNQLGNESFKFEILELCDEEVLPAREHYWCILLKTHDREYGYNLKETGDAPYTPPVYTESTAKEKSRKLSEFHKGKPLSEEANRRAREVNMGNQRRLGMYHSEVDREKIKEGLRKAKDKISTSRKGNTNKKGYVTSEETKQKNKRS